MTLSTNAAEAILRADRRLQSNAIHDEQYELTFATPSGRQIAINRKANKTALRIWIERRFDVNAIGLSSEASVQSYPAARPRAHLSAERLTGP